MHLLQYFEYIVRETSRLERFSTSCRFPGLSMIHSWSHKLFFHGNYTSLPTSHVSGIYNHARKNYFTPSVEWRKVSKKQTDCEERRLTHVEAVVQLTNILTLPMVSFPPLNRSFDLANCNRSINVTSYVSHVVI